MTDDDRSQLRVMIPILHSLLAIVGILILVFVVVPFVTDRVQSQSGVCEKEFHGEIIRISSLNPSANVEGSFFLGMGSVRTVRVYVAYTGNNQVGYSLVEYPISQSLIFEDENNSPYIDPVQTFDCNSHVSRMTTIYKFHVPEGTIKMEYSI